ncbi:MAG: hypothetical protein AUK03_10430 [Anaerolineae bacterium CG2_30_64_16]|nr:MAG: hypothetical protein AUK03_10430 [Anaerolineae bacterium CG2_30_64_16]
MANVMGRLRGWLGRAPRPQCDTCAYVQFFRSSGDGQAPRLLAFCRCPGGPHHDRPIPPQRRCDRWRLADVPAARPVVGDPTLTV